METSTLHSAPIPRTGLTQAIGQPLMISLVRTNALLSIFIQLISLITHAGEGTIGVSTDVTASSILLTALINV